MTDEMTEEGTKQYWAEMWIQAKEEENVARARRLDIEAKMEEKLNIGPHDEHKSNIEVTGGKVKVAKAMTSTVNVNQVMLAASEHNLESVANNVFKTSMRLDKREFDKLDDNIRDIFSRCITFKAQKTSFSYKPDEKGDK